MSQAIQGQSLFVPSIPVPMATNARLFVVARLSGRDINEMRSTIWAKKPLRFAGLDSKALEQLAQLFSSWGIKNQIESTEQTREMGEDPKPLPETTRPTEVVSSEKIPSPLSLPTPKVKTAKPVLLQSHVRKGNKRFFLVKSGRVSTAFGFLMAIAIFLLFPISGYILGFLGVPDQNLAEALAGWGAGALPSTIPAWDISYALPQGSSHTVGFFVSVTILAVLAIVAFVFRKSSAWFWFAGCMLFFHSSFSLYGEHRFGLLYLAHVMELFFCVLFLFRAFAGTQIVFYSERVMYAVAGWLLWLENLRFGWMLVQNGDKLKPVNILEHLGLLDLMEIGLAESLEILGVGLFTLNLAAPSIILAIMIILELRRPQILIHRT